MGYKICPITGEKYEYETKFEFNIKEIYWAAGFFDGEGCTYFYSDGTSNTNILGFKVVQIGFLVLERFVKVLGFGKVRGPYHADRNRQPRYEIIFQNFEETQAAIAIIWCGLSESKRKQYKKALKKFMEYAHNGKRKDPRFGLRNTKEIARISFY